MNERVAVVAKLLPGSRERAARILGEGAPYGLALAGFRRHSVFLAEYAVVFVFEGPRERRQRPRALLLARRAPAVRTPFVAGVEAHLALRAKRE